MSGTYRKVSKVPKSACFFLPNQLEYFCTFKARGNLQTYKLYKGFYADQRIFDDIYEEYILKLTPKIRKKSYIIPIWDDKYSSGMIKARKPSDFRKTIRHN